MNYYPFHIGDYAAHTRHLTPLEDLAYRRLLDAYYLREGPLPSDVQATARIIGLRDHVAEVQAVLVEFFVDAPEGWFSARAEAEIEAYRHKLEQASRAGKASAERRANSRKTSVQRTSSARSTPVEHEFDGCSTNQNQSHNQNQVPPKAPQGAGLFEEFWAAFPRKVGKDAAQKAFEKRKPDRALVDQMLAAIAAQKASPQWIKDGGDFIPHPSTWLNQGRWQDEPGEQSLWPSGYVPMGSPAGG